MNTKMTIIRGATVVAALALTTVGVHAQTLFTADFTGVDDSTPTGWTEDADSTGFLGLDSNEYRFDPITATDGRAHVSANDVNGDSPFTWTDYTVSSEFRASAPIASVGITGRVQLANTNSYYHARLGNGSVLQLYRVDNGAFTLLDSAVTDIIYSNGTTWELSLGFSGSTIVASLVTPLGTPLASLSVTDSTYTTGSAGIRARPSTGGGVAVWEDFVVSIPEPAVCSWVFGAVAIGAATVRRSRRRA